jgi:hypothetical protein
MDFLHSVGLDTHCEAVRLLTLKKRGNQDSLFHASLPIEGRRYLEQPP